MEDTFFEEMAHQLCTYNYKIDGQNVFYYISFIEEKHKRVPVKGFYFYTNLVLAMADYCGPLANIGKGETPSYKERIFNRVYEYCKKQITDLEIATESTKEKQEAMISKNNVAPKLEVTEVALMYVYLSMANGSAISEQNKNEKAKEYGFTSRTSGTNLRNIFVIFQKEDKRLDLNDNSKTSARKTLDRYKNILPILKQKNPAAYEIAQKEEIELQKKFDKIY
ncbi:MAG: hypothetical protein ACTHM7_05980 [Ginsengibacter sp.]